MTKEFSDALAARGFSPSGVDDTWREPKSRARITGIAILSCRDSVELGDRLDALVRLNTEDQAQQAAQRKRTLEECRGRLDYEKSKLVAKPIRQ